MMRGFDGNACRIAGRTGPRAPQGGERRTPTRSSPWAAAPSTAAGCERSPAPAGVDGVGVKDVPDLTNGKTVVNLPTCPVNPEWVRRPDRRLPARWASCRRSTRSAGRSSSTADHPRQLPAARSLRERRVRRALRHARPRRRGWCLYKIGCKGPQTLTNCPLVRWNRKVELVRRGRAARASAAATSTGSTTDAPFLRRMPDVAGVSPETIGARRGRGHGGRTRRPRRRAGHDGTHRSRRPCRGHDT